MDSAMWTKQSFLLQEPELPLQALYPCTCSRPCLLKDEPKGPSILLHSEQSGCGSLEKRCEEGLLGPWSGDLGEWGG